MLRELTAERLTLPSSLEQTAGWRQHGLHMLCLGETRNPKLEVCWEACYNKAAMQARLTRLLVDCRMTCTRWCPG